MSNTDRQERLQAAADCYQTLPDDSKFEGMVDYFKEKLGITDLNVVKAGIRQIRKHLARPGSWEYETARLEEDLVQRCEARIDDSDVWVSLAQWTENLFGDEIEFFKEEYNPMFPIGTKVRDIFGGYTEGTITRYAIVRANEWAYITRVDPFDEEFTHGYKQLRPRQENFENKDGVVDNEAYFAAVREYDRKEIGRQANIVRTAEMLFLEWFDCNGNATTGAGGWQHADKLREYTPEDAAADAALPLVDTFGNPQKQTVQE